MRRQAVLIAAMALLGAFAASAPASAAETVYGLTAGDNLITFSSDRPGSVSSPMAITGQGPGASFVGVDVRPATGQLYGVTQAGQSGRLYRSTPSPRRRRSSPRRRSRSRASTSTPFPTGCGSCPTPGRTCG